MLNKFSEAIRTNLTKNQRLKIVAIVTIEVHARDIIEKLAKLNIQVNKRHFIKTLKKGWEIEV